MRTARTEVDTYLQHLRGLPFVRGVTQNVKPRLDRHDFAVTIRTPKGTYRFRADELGSHLDQATLSRLLGRPHARSTPVLLMAPYVSREMAARLVEGGIAFVDRVGNCYLNLGANYVAHSVGRRPQPEPERAAFRAPAYGVLFVLLADPSLTKAPLRQLATLAEVSLGTVAGVMKRLRAERFIVGTGGKAQLVGASALLDRWISAYADVLRPRLLIGRYDPGADGPEVLEARIEKALPNRAVWAYGGTAAGHRLTQYYRGEDTVLHLSLPTQEALTRQLQAPPKPDGSLVLIQPPTLFALKGPVPHVAHPLLVYAEMLCTPSPRAAEAAREVRERFLNLP